MKTREWTKILKKIKLEYADSPSVFLIRGRMRDELGFTPRNHTTWVEDERGTERFRAMVVCLDFYDDAKETFFRMKYL